MPTRALHQITGLPYLFMHFVMTDSLAEMKKKIKYWILISWGEFSWRGIIMVGNFHGQGIGWLDGVVVQPDLQLTLHSQNRFLFLFKLNEI